MMTTKLLAMAIAAVVASSVAIPGLAAPGESPNGHVGACNMMQAGAGMTTAVSHAATQGHDGMRGAMHASGCHHTH